jgi:hypothetical protein
MICFWHKGKYMGPEKSDFKYRESLLEICTRNYTFSAQEISTLRNLIKDNENIRQIIVDAAKSPDPKLIIEGKVKEMVQSQIEASGKMPRKSHK